MELSRPPCPPGSPVFKDPSAGTFIRSLTGRRRYCQSTSTTRPLPLTPEEERIRCPPGIPVYEGPRGGRFVYTPGGRKHYCEPLPTTRVIPIPKSEVRPGPVPGSTIICGPEIQARRQQRRIVSPYVLEGPGADCITVSGTVFPEYLRAPPPEPGLDLSPITRYLPLIQTETVDGVRSDLFRGKRLELLIRYDVRDVTYLRLAEPNRWAVNLTIRDRDWTRDEIVNLIGSFLGDLSVRYPAIITETQPETIRSVLDQVIQPTLDQLGLDRVENLGSYRIFTGLESPHRAEILVF
jgi:hypothetical protein